MEAINVVNLSPLPILNQLRLEEALLRADTRNWCLINTGSPAAIVMGISGKYSEQINHAYMQKHPIPVIRRFSGGGTVLIDETTYFYTLIGNRQLLDVPCFPDKLLKWTERLYAPAFKGLDFKLKENDYVLGQHKFGGNAQYISKERWLHHSSLLWDYRSEMMDYLKMPPRTPNYRQGRSHADFLCRLQHHFQSPQQFQFSMMNALQQQFQIIEVSYEEVQQVIAREHRQTTSIYKLDFAKSREKQASD